MLKLKVGCVKEIKNREYRVGIIPDHVKSYVSAGHEVWMEKGLESALDFWMRNMKMPARNS